MADYTISTAAELVDLANQSNKGTSSSPITIELADDIDMREYQNWEGLGSGWNGTFDGKNHSILNISYTGFVAWRFISITGIVKNVTFSDISIVTSSSNRVMILYFDGSNCKAESVSVKGVLTNSGSGGDVLGIAWFNSTNGYCTNCSFSGSINASNIYGMTNSRAYNCWISCINGHSLNQNTANTGSVRLLGNAISNCFFIGNISMAKKDAGINLCTDSSSTCSYAVVLNAAELLNSGYVNPNDGITGTNCYFDNSGGNVFAAQYGQPTENLQNAIWLRQHGYAIKL